MSVISLIANSNIANRNLEYIASNIESDTAITQAPLVGVGPFALTPCSEIQSDLSLAAMRERYNGLGCYKWKECIDFDHQQFGERVYDEGLHGKQTESGFLQSMKNAFSYIEQTLQQPVTPAWYVELHRIACDHFNGAKDNTLIERGKVGLFRDESDKLCFNCTGYYTLTERGIAELEESGLGKAIKIKEEKGCCFWPNGIAYRPMSSEEVHERLQSFIHVYYAELARAETPEKKLVAIARFIQKLEWLHPVIDGTGRCDIAILNKLLTEVGFHPVLLNLPYASSTQGLNEWIEHLKKGLLNWEIEKKNQQFK